MIALSLLININFTTRVHLDLSHIRLVLKTGKTMMLVALTLILTTKRLTTNIFIGLHFLLSFYHLYLHWSLWYVGLTLWQALLRTPMLSHSFFYLLLHSYKLLLVECSQGQHSLVLLTIDAGGMLITTHLFRQRERIENRNKVFITEQRPKRAYLLENNMVGEKARSWQGESMLKHLVLTRLASYSQHCSDTTL